MNLNILYKYIPNKLFYTIQKYKNIFYNKFG